MALRWGNLYLLQGQTTRIVSLALWSVPSWLKEDTTPGMTGSDLARYSGQAGVSRRMWHGLCFNRKPFKYEAL